MSNYYSWTGIGGMLGCWLDFGMERSFLKRMRIKNKIIIVFFVLLNNMLRWRVCILGDVEDNLLECGKDIRILCLYEYRWDRYGYRSLVL